MEVAVIDWKSIDSRFVKDELYEHFNAPKWVELSALDDPVDDEAWFCRPGCNHPKTVEDFFNGKERTLTPNSKLQNSATVSNIPPFGDRNKREAMLKKRHVVDQSVALSGKYSKYHKFMEDSENQEPNFSMPPNHKVKVGKKAIKLSVEKLDSFDGATNLTKEQTPDLKSTLSARNLLAGGDFLGKVIIWRSRKVKIAWITISEFWPILKRRGSHCWRIDDYDENTPASLDVKKIKHRGAEGLQQIKTCPPSPQCFSDAPNRKPFKPKTLERIILQELKLANKELIGSNGRRRTTTTEVVERLWQSLWMFSGS